MGFDEFAEVDTCPNIAPFLGYMGVAASIILANWGAAHGTAKAGMGIMQMGIANPELVWRSLIPVVMAGVNGIYGLITSIIINGAITDPKNGMNTYSLYTGFAHLSAGLMTGLSGLASGWCIGVAGEAAVMASGEHEVMQTYTTKSKNNIFSSFRSKRKKKNKAGGKEKLFVAMVLIQVFAGNLALFGLISAIIVSQQHFACG